MYYTEFVAERIMQHLTLQVATLLCVLSFAGGSLFDNSWFQLEQMKMRVNTLHQALVDEECPRLPKSLFGKRNIANSPSDNVLLELETKLYHHMFDLLVTCRKRKQPTSKQPAKTILHKMTTVAKTYPKRMTTMTTQTTTTPTATTTPPTTTPDVTTTTATSAPVECLNAINLTESWRLDHSGSKIKPKNGHYNCDTRDMINAGRPWFRFTGNAGNKLLDHCVPTWSCGTASTMWSNSTMPDKVGVVTPITVYRNDGVSCTNYTKNSSVMRCSDRANDYVYRYDDDNFCIIGFCGMRA